MTTRQREHEKRRKAAGWRRMSPMLHPPATWQDIDDLIASEYATSITACVQRALADAARKHRKR